MPYAVSLTVQNSVNAATQYSVSSPNFTAIAGETMIAVVSTYGTDAPYTLADTVGSNNSWAEIGTGIYESVGATGSLRAYILNNASAGSCTIKATVDSSFADYPGIVVMSLSGLIASPLDKHAFSSQTNPGTGTDALTISTAALTGQPAAIIGVDFNPTSGSAAPLSGTGFTNLGLLWDYEGTYAAGTGRAQHKRVTSTSAQTSTMTAASGNGSHVFLQFVVALTESASGVTGTSSGTAAGVAGSATGLLVQVAVPTSDGTVNAWLSTGANLWSTLDEYPVNDLDYIYTETLTSACRIKLGSLTDPNSSVNHKLEYRARGNASATLTVKLYSGGTTTVGSGTLIRTYTHAALSATLADFAQTLSGAEADAITDYANLYLEFEAT